MTDAAVSPEMRLSAAGAVMERFAPPPPRATLPELLSAAAWRRRAIEVPEPLLGELVVSTTRMFVGGPTGLGKTHLGFAMAAGMASGQGFLHWRASRPARVLYIDGEMPRDLVQRRLRDLERRHDWAAAEPNLFVLCSEDFEELGKADPGLGPHGPLNTEAGQAFLLGLIARLGRIDAVFLDNRMSLLAGDMKDEVPWTETMPLVKELTRRRIAQVWFDHMGHNTEHIYGSKTKEWQIDVVAILKAVEAGDADLSFRMEFTKARRREKANRADFEPVTVTLREDVWEGSVGGPHTTRKSLTERPALMLRALQSLAAEGAGTLAQPLPGMPTVRAIALPVLRARLLRLDWYQENHLAASRPGALPDGGVLTDAGYKMESKALQMLAEKGLIGRARPEGRKGEAVVWLV
ncbi:AAA family ATPase [Plastoroseomonas hellenica]|uniref:AAA family ATPase n=1 Tax=Plastoroseomonas hellenica TaxID=2687306 RepID=UPI001BA71E9F|nr:AAA family ATPase [Plastoroseomonas hellenica]MBR0647332.1 AAA family ATPase [Plastoroseomonas hellenica]